jgi:hypothetical protein
MTKFVSRVVTNFVQKRWGETPRDGISVNLTTPVVKPAVCDRNNGRRTLAKQNQYSFFAKLAA